MFHSLFNRLNQRLTIWLVFLSGLIYLLFLASFIQPDVFFSGDGGLKFLVVKQINEGHGFKWLFLPHEQWVKNIWDQGFFPIQKPFVYPGTEGYIVSFRIPIISAFCTKYSLVGLYLTDQ
jgi:hypothetical protein